MGLSKTLNVLGLKHFTDERPDFYVNTLADHLRTSHTHINKPHKHSFYATFLFLKGSGIHEIDFNSYDVRRNTVFLLSPGQSHHWSLSDDTDGIVFFHSRELYEAHYVHEFLTDFPFFSTLEHQAAIYLSSDSAKAIVPLFEEILSVMDQKITKRKQLVLSLITQIYVRLEQAYAADTEAEINKNDSYYNTFLKFQRLVEENFQSERSVARYADWMNVTSKHLNRINRAIINKSTLEIINERIILEAKRILMHGRKNVSEVADELGFADHAHFSKMFKSKTGQSPSGFLKKYS